MRTEGILQTEHSLVTESLPATCTECGQDRVYCNVCGYEQSRTANANIPTGHMEYIAELAWLYTEDAGCYDGAYHYVRCATCSVCLREEWNPAVGHDPDYDRPTVVQEGTCTYASIMEYPCKRCGEMVCVTGGMSPNNHDWVDCISQKFNWVTGEFEDFHDQECTRCNAKMYDE